MSTREATGYIGMAACALTLYGVGKILLPAWWNEDPALLVYGPQLATAFVLAALGLAVSGYVIDPPVLAITDVPAEEVDDPAS